MKLKKKHYILLGILCLLIVTNPSISAFKAFRGKDSYSGLKRTLNLFIFSEYKDGYGSYSNYIGVLGNFFQLSGKSYSSVKSANVDTSKSAVDTVNIDPHKEKLEVFYEALKRNDNIIGLPDSYYTFKKTLLNPTKARAFYDSIKNNDNIVGLPKSYKEFSEKLGLGE